MDSNGIQGNELKFKAFPIDQDGLTSAKVDLPDQCQALRFETPAGIGSITAVIKPQMSDLTTYKQLRDNFGAQGDSYTVIASEPYRIKPELAVQLGSHFKLTLSSAVSAGLYIVVWYRSLL